MQTKLLSIAAALLMPFTAPAANIVDGRSRAWAENVGWIDFAPAAGAQVTADKLTGFIWSENIGWICLSCETTDSCDAVPYGVTNDGRGRLGGYAWSENAGWISFAPAVAGAPNDYGVTIAPDGTFSGWAWGENIGWINLNADPLVGLGVRACTVTLDDLAGLAAWWLEPCGPANPGCDGADLDPSGRVDLADAAVLARSWLDFCPDSWPL